MTTEDLNKRLSFCAEHGLPYSDRLWFALELAFLRGFTSGGAQSFLENCGQGQGGASSFQETL